MALESYANSPLISSPSTAWTTVNGALDASTTTVVPVSASAFPASGQYRIAIDNELLLVTAGAGTLSWTVQRGVEGTTAATHASGASIYGVLTAASLLRSPGALTDTGDVPYLASTGAPTRLAAGADGTYLRYASGVPTANTIQLGDVPAGVGLTASPLSQFAATTSAQLAGVLSDETGSGVAVFNDTPTLLTPTIASFANAAHSHLNAAGGGTITAAAISDLASAAIAFSNKTGNISQWTNDSGYLTSVTAHNVLSATHGDTVAASVTRGDVIIGNSTPKWARLAIGSASRYLSSDGTDVSWGQVSLTAGVTGTLPVANGGTGVTASTGSVAVVLSTSPTLVTPVLGVATCTSLNGNTFTAGSYTLTGAASKVLTFNNSLTLAGTDSTTMTFPTTSATIARTDAAQTFTGNQTISGLVSLGPGTGAPTYALHIAPTSGVTAQQTVLIRDATATTGFTRVVIQGGPGSTNAAGIVSILNNAGTEVAQIRQDGNVAGTQVETMDDATAALDQNGTVGSSSKGARLASTAVLQWSNSTHWWDTVDLFVKRSAAATLQLGVDVNGAAVAQTLQSCNAITGMDKVGSDFTIQSGVGTGAAAVSSLLFKTPTATTTGTTAQTRATRLTLVETLATFAVPVTLGANYLNFTEMTAPSAGATNNVRVYAQDNGSGKTQLMAVFPTGSAVQLAIEP